MNGATGPEGTPIREPGGFKAALKKEAPGIFPTRKKGNGQWGHVRLNNWRDLCSMRSFNEEYRELLTWYFSERDKIDETIEPWSGGYDGEHTAAISELGVAYRAKLRALRKKYEK